MVRTVGKTILKFFACSRFLKKMQLEPLKQPYLKMKILFKRETLNPNNEKDLVKAIGYKL